MTSGKESDFKLGTTEIRTTEKSTREHVGQDPSLPRTNSFSYCIRIRQAVAIRQPLVVFLHMRKARAPRERREHRRRPQLRQNENKNRAFPKAKKTLRALAITRKLTRNHHDMQIILHKRKNAQRVPHPPQKYFFIFRFLPRSE